MNALVFEGVAKGFSGGPEVISDLDLAVRTGSSLAMIGANGAGKSTMLKLAAGIYGPSRGRIVRHARCASIIELGAGFHPDLTGRENIEVSLVMAGVGHVDRRRAMGQVLDFADIGAAADRPIRHASTGMLARVACALAVRGEPDLLLVDEVLAVGDSAFQDRMLQAVRELVTAGSTLVLVTHSMQLAQVTTEQAVWIDDGRIAHEGSTADVVSRYEAAMRRWGTTAPDSPLSIEALRVTPDHVEPGGSVRVVADLRCRSRCDGAEARIEIRPIVGDDSGWMRAEEATPEMHQHSMVACTRPQGTGSLDAGHHRLEFELPRVPISPTLLDLSLMITDAAGAILAEASSDLAIGALPRRPQFHIEAELAPAGLGGGPTAVGPPQP